MAVPIVEGVLFPRHVMNCICIATVYFGHGIPGFGGHFLVDPPNLVGFSLFRGRCVCHFFWWTFFGGRLVSHFFWWTHFGGPLVWYFISWTLNQSCAPMVNFHVPESSIDWADVSQTWPLPWQVKVTNVSSVSASPDHMILYALETFKKKSSHKFVLRLTNFPCLNPFRNCQICTSMIMKKVSHCSFPSNPN